MKKMHQITVSEDTYNFICPAISIVLSLLDGKEPNVYILAHLTKINADRERMLAIMLEIMAQLSPRD